MSTSASDEVDTHFFCPQFPTTISSGETALRKNKVIRLRDSVAFVFNYVYKRKNYIMLHTHTKYFTFFFLKGDDVHARYILHTLHCTKRVVSV